MLRTGKSALAAVVLALLLSGCWDIKDVQDINYLTSVGFDYVDNQYVAYVQMLDFTSVAKTEGGKPNQPVPVWVGAGKGDTINAAFNDLYRTAQLRIFYGQINSVVISESVMKSGLKDVREMLGRYYELRYTPWLFGTNEPIDKLFAVTPFFNLSPLMSLLHQPQESYRQESLVPPKTIREFAADFREPDNSTIVPSLIMTNNHWESDGQSKTMLQIGGLYVFQERSYLGQLELNDVPGLRWVETETHRSPLIIRSAGKPQVLVSLESPDVKIVPRINGNKATYRLSVKLTGNIMEEIEPMSESEIERKAAELVKEEISQTYEKGLKLGADLLQLKHAMYRQNNRGWKMLKDREQLKLTPDSLEEIKVKVVIKHSGKLKAASQM